MTVAEGYFKTGDRVTFSDGTHILTGVIESSAEEGFVMIKVDGSDPGLMKVSCQKIALTGEHDVPQS